MSFFDFLRIPSFNERGDFFIHLEFHPLIKQTHPTFTCCFYICSNHGKQLYDFIIEYNKMKLNGLLFSNELIGRIYYFLKHRKMRHGEVYHYLQFILSWYSILPNLLLVFIFLFLKNDPKLLLVIYLVQICLYMLVSGVLSHFWRIRVYFDKKHIRFKKNQTLVHANFKDKLVYFTLILSVIMHQLVILLALLFFGHYD